jgi:hypothetical protein
MAQTPSRTGQVSGTVSGVTAPGGCTTPDPFQKNGGLGLCVNGEWLPLWRSSKKSGG